MYGQKFAIVIRGCLIRFGVGYDGVLERGQRRQGRRLSLVLDPAPYSRWRFVHSHALKRCTEPATKYEPASAIPLATVNGLEDTVAEGHAFEFVASHHVTALIVPWSALQYSNYLSAL